MNLFPPLQLGMICLDFPVIQAALSGYSDSPMRKIARSQGANFTLCEVLLDQFVVAVSRRKAKLYMQVDSDDHPCGAQLMGCEPNMFVDAAGRLVEAGFDLIDLNFACPVKKVLGRLRGGYFMSDPDSALVIIEKVRQFLPESIPLTVKLRRGFDDSDESVVKFYRILDGAVELGVAGFTVHGRTVKQKYTGESNWDFLKNVKSHLVGNNHGEIAIIGSGDLFSAETCLKRMHETGVNGLALARGAIGNPWLFGEVRALFENRAFPAPPTIAEQRVVLLEHYQLSEELYGQHRASTTMRGFGIRYSMKHPNAEEVRNDFVRLPWLDVLNKWYGSY